MIVELIQPNADGFRFLCKSVLRESIGNESQVEKECDLYDEGESSLWMVQNRGFLILAFYTDGEPFLEVRHGVGLWLYTKEGIEALKTVARNASCKRIVCTPKNSVVKRLLQRLGFKAGGTTEEMELKIE